MQLACAAMLRGTHRAVHRAKIPLPGRFVGPLQRCQRDLIFAKEGAGAAKARPSA
ncbi:hypothetical protein C357_10617 [Citreicella sp. 357]|nr:hypothetical protein C357_10617 [Citreicella sp. 357]